MWFRNLAALATTQRTIIAVDAGESPAGKAMAGRGTGPGCYRAQSNSHRNGAIMTVPLQRLRYTEIGTSVHYQVSMCIMLYYHKHVHYHRYVHYREYAPPQ